MVLLSYYALQLSLSLSLYCYRLMELMRCAEVRYSMPCRAVLHRLSAYTTMEVTSMPGLEKVQQQTLSLLDNVSTTILTSIG